MNTVLYHPGVMLKDEFSGLRCKRCGVKLGNTPELCRDCEKAMEKDAQRQKSWENNIDPKTKAYVPGRTF